MTARGIPRGSFQSGQSAVANADGLAPQAGAHPPGLPAGQEDAQPQRDCARRLHHPQPVAHQSQHGDRERWMIDVSPIEAPGADPVVEFVPEDSILPLQMTITSAATTPAASEVFLSGMRCNDGEDYSNSTPRTSRYSRTEITSLDGIDRLVIARLASKSFLGASRTGRSSWSVSARAHRRAA